MNINPSASNSPQPFILGADLLGKLESFSSGIFLSDNVDDQMVCDFVLVLALVFNDLQSVIWARDKLRNLTEGKKFIYSKTWGLIGGLHIISWRYVCGIFNELIEAIRSNKIVFDKSIWKRLLAKIPKEDQENWNEVLNLTQESGGKDSVFRILRQYRHNIAFHYYGSGKHLRSGLKKYSIDNPNVGCLLSRGDNILSTRYYFADAAAQQYMALVADENTFDRNLAEPAKKLARLLRNLVESFIFVRGGSVREFRENS